jgi:hypothetical protein
MFKHRPHAKGAYVEASVVSSAASWNFAKMLAM